MRVSVTTLRKMIREAVEECMDEQYADVLRQAAARAPAGTLGARRPNFVPPAVRPADVDVMNFGEDEAAVNSSASRAAAGEGGAETATRSSTTSEAAIRRMVREAVAEMTKESASEVAIRKLVRKNVQEALRGSKR